MKALVITNVVQPATWAVWQAVSELGVDVHLAGSITPRDVEVFTARPALPTFATVHPVEPRDVSGRGQIWWYYPGLRRLIERVRPDVVHVNTECWSVVASQACGVRPPVVLHGAENQFRHGRPVEDLLRRALARRNLSRCAGYLSWNKAGADLVRSLGLPSDAMTHVAPAVVPVPVGDGMQRQQAGVGPKAVGFVGRLEPVKGLAWLLDSMALMTDAPLLRVAGSGHDEEALRQQAIRLGLEVEWHGLLRPDEVGEFLSELDLLIVPSVTRPDVAEQFGRVVVEAFWAGTPVVVSSSGALPEVVGTAGVIVAENDRAALAAAVADLIGDPRRRRDLAAAGRARAEAVYAPSVIAQTLLSAWQAAAAR